MRGPDALFRFWCIGTFVHLPSSNVLRHEGHLQQDWELPGAHSPVVPMEGTARCLHLLRWCPLCSLSADTPSRSLNPFTQEVLDLPHQGFLQGCLWPPLVLDMATVLISGSLVATR